MSSNSSSLIFSVSSSLRILLSNFLQITEADIRFESIGELTTVPDKGLALFLYKVAENPHLKNHDSAPDFYSNPVFLRNPPIVLDLYYLITPFGNSEQRLITIEGVLQFFHDNPIVSESMLSESLLDSGNKEIKVLLNDMTIEQLNSLWNMFPNTQYRPSLSYLLSPLFIPSNKVSDLGLSRVTTETFSYFKK